MPPRGESRKEWRGAGGVVGLETEKSEQNSKGTGGGELGFVCVG